MSEATTQKSATQHESHETEKKTMRAAAIESFGGPEVLELKEVPVPEPGPGHVRLRVEAAAVNPVDLGTRGGRNIPEDKALFPMILGWDVAGTVDAVGEDIEGWQVGDRAIAMSVQVMDQIGTYAEQVVLDASLLASYPAGATPEEAATLPLAGLTAYRAVETLGLEAGQILLVNGPLGGVGGFAVQLATRRGVTVVAPVRNGEAGNDAALARELGAKIIIDRDDMKAQAREAVGNGLDAALDVVGGQAAHAALGSVRDDGKYATVVAKWWIPGGPFESERGIEPQVVYVSPNQEHLEELSGMLSTGELKPRVAKKLGLEEAHQAHELLGAGGVRGKIVLVP